MALTFASTNDCISGLSYCKNQYDLCETFPFTGLACKVKRNEGSSENPRLVEYKNIYIHAVIDIAHLTHNQWNISTSEQVDINGFLPLFTMD